MTFSDTKKQTEQEILRYQPKTITFLPRNTQNYQYVEHEISRRSNSDRARNFQFSTRPTRQAHLSSWLTAMRMRFVLLRRPTQIHPG
jgi:hypothetical protein